MPPETLATFQVTPDDVAATFRGTQTSDIWERYQRAIDWHRRNLSIPNAAAEEGIFCTRSDPEAYNAYRRFADQFRRWLPAERGGSGDIPFSARAVIDLHELGIFPGKDGYEYEPEEGLWVDHLEPFTAQNPCFLAISMLSHLRFLEGSLNVKEPDRATTQTGYFSSKNMKDPALLSFVQAVTECPDHQVSPDKRFTYIDALQGRFMQLLGNVIGHHGDTNLLATRPLRAALETLKKPKSTPQDITLAERILSDFGLAFFGLEKARVQPRYVHQARGQILGLLNREHAVERAELFVEIMEKAEIGTSRVNSFGPYKKATSRGEVHYSVINFTFDGPAQIELDLLKQAFFARIEELTSELKKAAP